MGEDFECGTCGKVFDAGYKARNQHLRSTGHSEPDFECDSCSRYFNSESARFQHMNARNHFYWKCTTPSCKKTWPTEEQRQEHEYDEHFFCKECNRIFLNRNSLKIHLRSRTHRGTLIQCPLCKACFVSATGLTHHVESGGCPEILGSNREILYDIICQKDTRGRITKNLLEWHDNTEYQATNSSWNDQSGCYECYLCHHGYRSLAALNQHLKSSAHKQNLYHCPKRSCGREFKILGSLVNHLENESCGCIHFEKVQQKADAIVSTLNRIII